MVVDGVMTEGVKVISGVPQGSVLGPIMFIIYINDLPEVVKGNLLMFADDTKLFRAIRNVDDCMEMQSDLYQMEKWADTWLLSFNQKKCEQISLGRKGNHQYKFGGANLMRTAVVRDLGVFIEEDLSFCTHISNKVSLANKMNGLIRRSFRYLSKDAFAQLFKVMVRPHLEFAAAGWNPCLRREMKSLENVQRRATKCVQGLGGLSYPERLRELNLPTLGYRRMRGDMVELFKITSGIYDEQVTENLLPMYRNYVVGSGLRGHSKKLFIQRYKKKLRGNILRNRAAGEWNSLPVEVVEAATLKSFERKLDKFWKDRHDKYTYGL